MTKQSQLLHFIKSGHNQTRTWSECRAFYATISPELCRMKEGGSPWGNWKCTAKEANKINNHRTGRAMDYALFRLESSGLTVNIARGLHQAT